MVIVMIIGIKVEDDDLLEVLEGYSKTEVMDYRIGIPPIISLF